MNNAFVMYADILPQLSFLSREQMGDLFTAILQYVTGEDVEELDDVTRMAFGFITSQIDRDRDKYKEKCEKAKQAAKNRWNADDTEQCERIKRNANDADACERIKRNANDADACERINGNAKNANAQNAMHIDTDTVTDTDTVIEKESVKRKTTRTAFAPPTITDVQNYADSNGYKLDAERFVDYYSSKGWTVGKSPMKDWRAAVRNWAKNDRASPAKNTFTNFEHRSDNASKYAALEQMDNARYTPPEDYAALEAALLGRT